MAEWIRHGDVVLERADKKITPKERAEKLVLAEGEVTGHKHVLSGQVAECVMEGERFVEVKGEAVLTHPEHDTLTVPEGTYKVLIQREVDLLGEVRQVMD